MRVALLGISHWHASMHLDAVRAAGAAVSAVWDEDGPLTQAFAARHGLHAASDPDAAAAGADLVVLMGHPVRLPPLAHRLIDRQVPLILEKPAAATTEGIAALAVRARERAAFVAVPLANRFSPAMVEFRRLSSLGRAGAIGHAAFRLVNGPPRRYRTDGVGWLLDPAVAGGGALRNLGIHGIDCALALSSGSLTLAAANIGRRLWRDEAVEDHAFLLLQDAGGALFGVEAGYTYASLAPGGDFEWRIVSANATLIDRGDRVTVATLDDGTRRDLPPEDPALRYRLFAADTLARLAAEQPPSVTLDDYLAAMRLIDAAYREAGQ